MSPSSLKVSHLSGDIYECRPLFILNKINSMMEMNVIYATGSMINIASLNTGCTLYIFEGHSAVVTSIHVFNANSSNINKHDFNDGIEIISTSLDGAIVVWNMVSYFEEYIWHCSMYSSFSTWSAFVIILLTVTKFMYAIILHIRQHHHPKLSLQLHDVLY